MNYGALGKFLELRFRTYVLLCTIGSAIVHVPLSSYEEQIRFFNEVLNTESRALVSLKK